MALNLNRVLGWQCVLPLLSIVNIILILECFNVGIVSYMNCNFQTFCQCHFMFRALLNCDRFDSLVWYIFHLIGCLYERKMYRGWISWHSNSFHFKLSNCGSMRIAANFHFVCVKCENRLRENIGTKEKNLTVGNKMNVCANTNTLIMMDLSQKPILSSAVHFAPYTRIQHAHKIDQ